MNAKDRLIRELGSQAEIARRLGLHRSAVNDWDVIPAKYAFWAEEETSGKVTARQVMEEWRERYKKKKRVAA